MHVRGYKEKGNINTPLELAINNKIDRFSLAMDVIDRVPRLQRIGGHAKERFLNQQIECRNYAHEHGIDKPNAATGCGRIREFIHHGGTEDTEFYFYVLNLARAEALCVFSFRLYRKETVPPTYFFPCSPCLRGEFGLHDGCGSPTITRTVSRAISSSSSVGIA